MKKVLESIPEYKLILILLLLALLLRLPWLYTTIEKDEGQFGYTSWRWLSGEELYTDLKDNKPPLLYAIYALPISLFGNSIIPVRIMNNLLFLISLIFFFKLAKNIFSKKTAFFSTLFYTVFMNIPVFEGYLAMSESLLMPFFIISLFFFEKYTSTRKTYFLFISSIFASISMFIKQQAIFLFFLLIGGLFVYKEKDKIKKTVLIILVPLALVLFLLLYNKPMILGLLQRTWTELTDSPLGFSSGYQHFSYNFFILMEGSFLLLFSIIGLLKMFQTEMREKNYFLISWLFISAIFTLIPPAYGHYYIFLIPPLSIFAGLGLTYSIRSNQNKKLFILTSGILLVITSFLVINHYPNSTIDYNHFRWGWSNFESYDQQIGLAEYIKSSTPPEESVLLVGWEPAIYWLSERTSPYKSLDISQSVIDTINLEQLIKNKNLTRVLFINKNEGHGWQSDFLSNKNIVQKVEVYEITLYQDYCHIYALHKQIDKRACDIVSAPVLKQTCLAIVGKDFSECDKISHYFFKNQCLILSVLKSKDSNSCQMISDTRALNFCRSVLNGTFDYESCVGFFKLHQSEKKSSYICGRQYAIFMNEVELCDMIGSVDETLLCKGVITSDKSYCENITNKVLYAGCMAAATSSTDYCNLGKRN